MSINEAEKVYQLGKIEFQSKAIARHLWCTCLNCEHWDKKAELCNLAGARPPLSVVVTGCPSWLDEIPF